MHVCMTSVRMRRVRARARSNIAHAQAPVWFICFILRSGATMMTQQRNCLLALRVTAPNFDSIRGMSHPLHSLPHNATPAYSGRPPTSHLHILQVSSETNRRVGRSITAGIALRRVSKQLVAILFLSGVVNS